MATGKWGNIRGKVFLTQEVVASDWKGMNTYRNLTRHIDQVPRQNEDVGQVSTQDRKSYLTSASKKWSSEMSDLQRAKWDTYAKMLKSSYNRMKEDVARGSGNIIRQRKKLESGFNAYMQSNLAAIDTGCQTTIQFQLDAPFQDGFPPAPMSVGITYAAPNIAVTWVAPDLTPFAAYFCKKFRVWCQVRAIKKLHPQIVGFIDVATPPPFTFNSIRGSKYVTAVVIPITELVPVGGSRRVEISVQMDTIVKLDDPAMGGTHGATLGGDPSNVARIMIP